AAGAMSHIDICQVTNLATSLQALKKAGAWIFGAVKDAEAQSLYEADLAVPACVVVGSEGQGIRPLVRKQCDVLISIPMEGQLDSLNSSVAAGVIMFEMSRQRNL
ncbi:MAG: RNA methyltransferase, partial [Proteobacteria bacterium]|nr:RNA methyltransferase [Pseudomonadota bacterium]